jgi:hypothetical protein
MPNLKYFIRFESRPNIAGGVTLPDDVTLTPVDESGDCQQQQMSQQVFDHQFDRPIPVTMSSSNSSTSQSEGIHSWMLLKKANF